MDKFFKVSAITAAMMGALASALQWRQLTLLLVTSM